MVSQVEPDEPAVLPSATGQERLINILGGRVSGQSTWGPPLHLQEQPSFPVKKATPQETREQEGELRRYIREQPPSGATAGTLGGTPTLSTLGH